MKKAILIILSFLMYQGIHAQYFEYADFPSWAAFKNQNIETTVNKYDVQNGFYYLQYDQITHYESETELIRYRSKILNSAGIDYFSQLNIAIDTSFQKIHFYSYKIIRDGVELDRTKDLDIKLINSEAELDQNVFSGIMSANAVLKDLRKNDIVEMAYSISGTNPLFANQYHRINYLQGINHIDYLSFQFIYPKDKKFQFRITDKSKIELEELEKNNSKYYNVFASNIEPAELEETMSLSLNPYNILEISSHDSWNSVKLWAEDLFNNEKSSELDSLFHLLHKPKESLETNATTFLEYVQNNIRYTSINGGIGSFLPSLPSEVILRNYGDCKDKCLLLVHLLEKLGVEYVFPALVNSSSGKKLNEYLYGTDLFDHVIVKCKLGDQVLWLDPSNNLQGGNILNRSSYDYGYALVIDKNAKTNLELMNIENAISRTEIIEEFDLSDVEKDGTLKVITIFKGRNADYMRTVLDYYSLKDLGNSFKEAYSKIFNQVEDASKISIQDDYEKNEIIMEENYTLIKPWKEIEEKGMVGYLLSYEPMNIYNYVAPTSCDKKKYEIEVEKTISFNQVTKMKLPKDAIYRIQNIDTKNSVYDFTKKQKIIDVSNTEIVYDINYKTDRILPEDFNKYCIDVNADCRNLLLNIVWISEQ